MTSGPGFTFDDLSLAWRRVLCDIETGRLFVEHPFEMELIKEDLDGWLSTLQADLSTGAYSPSSITICDVPKGGGAIRPGGILSLRDQVVYAACVGSILPYIRAGIKASGLSVDFSYHLNPRDDAQKWLQPPYRGWDQFRVESLKQIDNGTSCVVLADVVGYYENVDHATLISDLRQVGAPKISVDLLANCLRRWAPVVGRSLPQGFSPSDILGKFYLSRVDQRFANRGYRHFRYVDDFRIFCTSETEGKQAIIELTRLLRIRGLTPHTGKTEVHGAAEARAIIEGVIPTLKNVKGRYVRKVAEVEGFGAAYITLKRADEFLEASHARTAPLELLEHAYTEAFLDKGRPFDKTLFHFVLHRFARAKSRFALASCLELLRTRPEETSEILAYFTSVGVVTEVEDAVAHYLQSPDAVYTFQIAKAIEWRLSEPSMPSEIFTSMVRSVAFDKEAPGHLRSIARAYLAKFGGIADLDGIEQDYSSEATDLEGAEILCSLRRVEKARRNALLAKCEKDGVLTARACRLVKAGKLG